jgi:hypothetical protein
MKPLMMVKTGWNIRGNLYIHNNLVTSKGIYTFYILLKQCERAYFNVFQVGVLADTQTRSWIQIRGITVWANMSALSVAVLDACTCMQSLPNDLKSDQNRYKSKAPTYVSHRNLLFIDMSGNK